STLILGGGTIGLCTLVAARAAGAMVNVVTDAVPFNLQSALALGAPAGVNARGGDPRAVVAELTGGSGVDTAFVCVGISPVVNQAMAAIKKRGQMIFVALFDGKVTLDDPFQIVGGERVIRGSHTYTRADFQTATDLIANGTVDARRFITQRLPMSALQHGFEIADTKSEDCIKVVLGW
ncbi:MAG: zinc-binding dehydrogenase, partial [Chloroflexota bacterium]